jgi:hypothetical protein
MENFFLYISKPVDGEEFDFWVDSNNICYLKMELFQDFVISLVNIVYSTYLGHETTIETNIKITEEDDLKHFDWCWEKTIKNFNKEGVYFELDGEHKTFIRSFLDETFYSQKVAEVRMSLVKFFSEVFNMDTIFTKSDLDLLTTLYKSLEKNVKVNLQ